MCYTLNCCAVRMLSLGPDIKFNKQIYILCMQYALIAIKNMELKYSK